jgi:hypothetical protein
MHLAHAWHTDFVGLDWQKLLGGAPQSIGLGVGVGAGAGAGMEHALS